MTLREVNRVGEGQKNVPKLRFKGYEDAWEQRKLDCTNTVFTDGNYGESYPKSSDMTDSISGVPFLTGGNLRDGKLSINGASYITLDKHLELTSGHLEEDDIVIAVRGSLGALGYVNYNNAGWNINSQLAILRTNKNELYGAFLIQYLLSQDGQNELLKRQTGSALKQLPIKSLKDLKVPISSIDEQKEIANFLSQLDNRITLHQRKYDALKTMKKTLLSKMFPKDGEDIPEIRFKEFTDAWEQRKLGIDINVTSVKRVHQSDWETEGVPFYRARDIVSEFKGEEISEPIFVSKKIYEEFSRISGKVQADDLLVTGVGTIGVPYLVKSNNPLYFKDGNVIWVQNNKKLNGYFLFYTFITNPLQNFIRESAGTGTVGTLTIETCKRIPVFIPEKKEQIAVGEFFQSLDNLITLHQRKLDELKNMKKTLLQQMFV